MSGAIADDFREYIVANIDEDTPRLAYADWLMENGGDERAEFIRVQVERARLPAWDAAQVRLRVREQELLARHGEAWLAELPAIDGAKWEGFRRGIVAEVSFASFEAMRANVHACRAVAPVEAVTVRWPRSREKGRARPPVAELRELSLTGRPAGENEVGWLADSPQLATLRALTVRGLWEPTMRRLTASPHLARLKTLRLPGNDLGTNGTLALVNAAALAGLEELDLHGRGVSERYLDDPVVRSPGMEALAGWAGLAGVRSLVLAGNEFGAVGLGALLRSPHIGALKNLSVRAGWLNGAAMAEFRDVLPGLKLDVLDLGENVIGAVGTEHLAAAPCLDQLKTLRLDRCEIPLAGARQFAKEAGCIDGLRLLDVAHNHFAAAGLGALLDRKPAALHTLQFRDNDLYDKGAALLAGSPASDTLLELDLRQNTLGTAALKALGAASHLRKLLVLRLADSGIKEPAAEFAMSPLGKRLNLLDIEAPSDPSGPRFGWYDPIPF